MQAASRQRGSNFYPRPPRGGRRCGLDWNVSIYQFLSTPSARRATPSSSPMLATFQFLSTPSARRATGDTLNNEEAQGYFYPRPPRGGRQVVEALGGVEHGISIHALREEGDRLCSAP